MCIDSYHAVSSMKYSPPVPPVMSSGAFRLNAYTCEYHSIHIICLESYHAPSQPEYNHPLQPFSAVATAPVLPVKKLFTTSGNCLNRPRSAC